MSILESMKRARRDVYKKTIYDKQKWISDEWEYRMGYDAYCQYLEDRERFACGNPYIEEPMLTLEHDRNSKLFGVRIVVCEMDGWILCKRGNS